MIMSAKKYTGHYVYKMWLAYKQHFYTKHFNVLKYPVAKCNRTTYDQSRLRGLFEWLADEYPAYKMKSVLLANFVQGLWGVEDDDPFFMRDQERTKRAYKDWAYRMRHFRVMMEDSADAMTASLDTRFKLFLQGYMCPEVLLISMADTDEMMQLQILHGQPDSFPNRMNEVIFLSKYDLLLELIPPVAEEIRKKRESK